MAFKPDGSELLVAADTRVLIYDGVDGTLLQALKGHKDLVYTVAWSYDGQRFATGSADKSVILWTEQHEGTLKYTHHEAIQKVIFSPTQPYLLSVAFSDFGIWSGEESNVAKIRVQGRATSAAWNQDGSMFAIGTFEGAVYMKRITDVLSNEPSQQEHHVKIERPGGEPIWALGFSPPKVAEDGSSRYADQPTGEVLCITDWARTISFYDLEGMKVNARERELNYDPTCLQYFNAGQFLVIGGSNKAAMLYTRMGIKLGTISQMDTWIWSLAIRPNSMILVAGCIDGTIACYQLMFSTVHGLHNERYANREGMTDVVVQHLSRHTQVRIKCYDLVKKVAICDNKLAVQLSDRINIYKQVSGDRPGEPLEYKLVDKILKSFECSLLVVTARHVLMCSEQKLDCYDHKGLRQREWIAETHIRYIKVSGGPAGRETILLGLRDGQIQKLFIDNPFPVPILKLANSVRCLDLSLSRRFLGLVDENGIAMVFNLKTMEVLFQEPNCNSIAFNTEYENLICYSGNGILTVRVGMGPSTTQRMMGFVVGFTGNMVYCLHMYTMTAVEISFASHVRHFVDRKEFVTAYEVACHGVTREDWDDLGKSCLAHLQLQQAAKCFARNRDLRKLTLIASIIQMQKRGESDLNVRALLLAYQGKFHECAQLYKQNGQEQKALELYTDMRMFDEAQEIMANTSGETQRMLLRKRADWARDSNEPKVAAEMFIASGDFEKAIMLIEEHDWHDLAINALRRIERTDHTNLRRLAAYFISKKDYGVASKIFVEIGDVQSLLEMHVSAKHWNDAFAIAERYPKFKETVYLPYARSLAEQDKFDEAQQAFHLAGSDAEALKVLEQLTENAIMEDRFSDAGYYNWLLGFQYLDRVHKNPGILPKALQALNDADVYWVFEWIHRFCSQPFTRLPVTTLLNAARFLSPYPTYRRVSKVMINYTLAKLGQELGAYKLAREGLDRLTQLRLPPRYEKLVEVATVKVRAKPFTDREDLLPMCYRCGITSPLTVTQKCVHCSTPYVYSFATLEVLPLVEFFVEPGVSSGDAKFHILAEPPMGQPDYSPIQETKRGSPVICSLKQLEKMDKGHVVISEQRDPLPTRYFFNVMPTFAIAQCPSCCKLFEADEWEMAVVEKGGCPFCRKEYKPPNAHLIDDNL